MAKTIRLAVYFNDELRAVKELTLPFVIGRSQDANLTISHPMVSRRHCLLFENKGSVRLQDLGSLNGTFFGEERVKDVALSDEDEFLIGNIRFVFNPIGKEPVSACSSISESDLVDAEIVLQSDEEDDLPPPLPQSMPPKQQGQPTVPSFIKPLPSFQNLDDEENGIIEVGDIVDLAQVENKKTMPPPLSPRDQK